MGKIIRHCRTCADAPVFGNAFFWVLFAFLWFWGLPDWGFDRLGSPWNWAALGRGRLELLVMNNLHIYCNILGMGNQGMEIRKLFPDSPFASPLPKFPECEKTEQLKWYNRHWYVIIKVEYYIASPIKLY